MAKKSTEVFSRGSVLIVPGWQDSDESHWQTLWETRHAWKRVAQKDWLHPERADWLSNLRGEIQSAPTPPVLVCHSLGCIAVAHLAAENPQAKIRGAFLVAPPDLEQRDTPAEILGFHPTPLQRLPFPSILVASTTDPYCTPERSAHFARAWGSHFKNVGDRHHIGNAANLGNWVEGELLFAMFLAKLPS